MRLCPECLGAGSFEVYQEHQRVHCTICNGDGELPDCPRCGDSMIWNDEEQHFYCRCGEE